MANERHTPDGVDPSPTETEGDPSDFLSQQVYSQQFELSESMGRVLEKLDTHSKTLENLQSDMKEVKDDAATLIREFGYIKKFWWLGLVVLGVVLKVVYDDFVKPAIQPSVVSAPQATPE